MGGVTVPLSIGIDVGGTKVLGVVADGSGTVLDEVRAATPVDDGPRMVEAMAHVAMELRQRHPEVTALGAGVAGLVTLDGVVRFSPNLPSVLELPVGPMLEEAVGLPVRLDNDATCALWGEHRRGAARGVDDVALVTLGTGVGGAFVLGGRLVRGANGFAGEVGHMVVARDGIRCVCGRRGCWERYASGTGLGRMGREVAEAGAAPRLVALAGGDAAAVRGEHVTMAATEGDGPALGVLDLYGDWIAIGLVNLAQLLDVSRFVLGGGLAASGAVLLAPIRAAYDRRAVAPDHRPPVEIVTTAMGEHSGAVGAALLAVDEPAE
jgi:glucokinase